MTKNIEIRESISSDISHIEELYGNAFPDEDLNPLMRDLLDEPSGVLSLAAVIENELVGHVIFTTCGIDGKDEKVSLLGPLAVAPAWQKQGIGSMIVNAGLERVKQTGTKRINVLGDPAYYGRFGFKADETIEMPYSPKDPLPAEWQGAWQTLDLTSDASSLSGTLSVPTPWQHEALWLP